MKIEGGRIINDFIEPNKRQYSIPVYQRNYEWPGDQCRKLFEDIVEAYRKDKQHFCGSVVYALLDDEQKIYRYVIVDGQQRLTTIYLLLKALIDCASSENEKSSLEETVFNRDKYDEYTIDTASKLKLKPIKSDNNQLSLLMDNQYDEIDKNSGIWTNYSLFKEMIQQLLEEDPSITVKNIYKGIEKLTCACIKLDADDNAQEIFERINSTGVRLSLADLIRNFVLMTDADQETLYEDFWLKIEEAVQKDQMSEFFLDYLNLKLESFAKEETAYEEFKRLFRSKNYTNHSMLKELLHYAKLYHAFMNGDSRFSDKMNEYLSGLRQLKQGTVLLFLFHVFDDYDYGNGIISTTEMEKILQLLLSYSIRRIMCEVSSNSLRGLYKSLYNRVFQNPANKEHYYDAIVSFLGQMTSRDVIPADTEFLYALRNNNLYGKHFLCRYLLVSIENQGSEKLLTDNLTIEHVMPQNKNLSTAWQKMLGENWITDRDRWLHTLGNLTLTGYNSELGDRPFLEKKSMIEEKQTKVVVLYKDIQDKDQWNTQTISARADRLANIIFKLFPIIPPEAKISFADPKYGEYTCADPDNAKGKKASYYVLLGERVAVDSFAEMARSVARKLYDLDSSVIERMARNNEVFSPTWTRIPFSYDVEKVYGKTKLRDTDIYISTNFTAPDCIWFIRGLLKKYDLDLEEDFVYCARETKSSENEENTQ